MLLKELFYAGFYIIETGLIPNAVELRNKTTPPP
jgi:hypothetical protein